jgi:2,3-bisphosphoglycerate-independent phosphoglycerate mutase
MSIENKVCLIVLDGWGKGKSDEGNAIFMANTPFVDLLNKTYPVAQLRTDGENVGLARRSNGE